MWWEILPLTQMWRTKRNITSDAGDDFLFFSNLIFLPLSGSPADYRLRESGHWNSRISNGDCLFRSRSRQHHLQQLCRTRREGSEGKQFRYHGACHKVAIFRATILVLFHVFKSLQFIWRLDTCRWNLRVPNLQMKCRYLTYKIRHQDSCANNVCQSDMFCTAMPPHHNTMRFSELCKISWRRRQMTVIASQITSRSSVCSALCFDWQQRNIKGPRNCPFVRGIHQWPVDSLHKGDSDVENVPIWWCHNGFVVMCIIFFILLFHSGFMALGKSKGLVCGYQKLHSLTYWGWDKIQDFCYLCHSNVKKNI